MTLPHLPLHAAVVIALALALSRPIDSNGQTPITADSSGVATRVDADGATRYRITGGTVSGTNLFHSFARFDVPSGITAAFGGPAGTANVISRVTTIGEASAIDGRISTRTTLAAAGSLPAVTAMMNANFIFINPAGVTFGPSATNMLDIGGAFRVATADYIKLTDGTIFSATPAPGAVLTSAAPQAFGFLGSSPAAITVEGGNLQVGTGRTLLLVGGKVEIIRHALTNRAALVRAPGGVLQIASVASPGEATLGAADLGFSSFPGHGDVTISGSGTIVDALQVGAAAGTVVIRGGRLTIDQATVRVATGSAAGPAVGLDLSTSESIVVSNGALVQSLVSGAGSGSGIRITTGRLSLTDDAACANACARIESSSPVFAGNGGRIEVRAESVDMVNGKILTVSQQGRAGDIDIRAPGTVTVAGPGGEISTVKLNATNTLTAGNIFLEVGDLILRDQAKIQSGGRVGQQPGDSIEIIAANSVSISGLAGISSQAFSRSSGAIDISAMRVLMDGGFVLTNTLGVAPGGSVQIDARTVALANGAQIASSSQRDTPGAGGSIAINALESLTIGGGASGAGVGGITFTGSANSGLFSTAGGTGNAGQIALSTPRLTVDGGRVSVVTTAAGNAGTIAANVGNFALTSGGRVESSTSGGGAGGAITFIATEAGSMSGLGSGLFSTASGTGNAGQIAITAPALTMADGGRISVATEGAGGAGTIAINAGTASLSGGARIDSSTTAGGAGGAMAINGTDGASSVSLAGSGTGLFSTASSTGNAGAIGVSTGNVVIASSATIDSSTTGAGAGGAINVTAASQVEILNGGSIRADSLGSGTTGDINVTAGNSIVMNNGTISTSATTADGGNIKLTAPHMVQLSGSQITTSVASGTGSGGNISIDPEFVILKGSSITANAFGGPGGNVTIVANTFLIDPASVVEASSALSTPGTVLIQSPDNNVAGDIAQLPGELVDASRLLQGACSARRAGAPSSFTVAGRGGVPVDPDGYLPSFVASGGPFAGAPGASAGHRLAVAMAGWDCWR